MYIIKKNKDYSMANNLNYNYPWGYDYNGDSGTGMINPPAFPGGSGVDEDEMNTAIQSAVDKLVGTAPETLDTLGEIADALESGEGVTEALIQQINKKLDKETYIADKSTFVLKSELPTKLSEFTNDVNFITNESLVGYAKVSDVNEQLSEKLDIVSYESDKETFAKINNVYTKEEADSKFLTEHQDISGLATKVELEEVSNSIPTKVSDIENDSNFISTSDVDEKLSEYTKSSEFATVATSGSYDDLENKPIIPVVPENVSVFTNDAGYLTEHQDLSSYINNASYDNESKTIDLKHDENIISSINAVDFIKDGMVDSVTIKEGNLVITFNTDSGKEPINIALTDIFNPENYYNKQEIDTKINLKANSSDLSVVATSGSYNDLLDKPEIPVIPQNVSAFTNDVGYLTEHQDISGLATKTEVETGDKNTEKSILERIWSKPTDPDKGYFQTKYTSDNGNYAQIWNESNGGGSQYFNATDNVISYVGVNDGGKNDICVQIYSKDKGTNVGSRLNVNPNGMFYAVGDAASTEAGRELAVKDDITATEAELQAIIDEKNAIITSLNTELYNLKKAVGNIGGAVTYELPGVENKSFNTLMNNNGTVKLTDDVTTGRFGPGIMANNKVTLNLNNKNLTITGLTISSSQAAIMARGTQEITINGKGIIDAGEGICIEANSTDTIINLKGTTTTYHTNRPGGELVYCYAGTINISGGIFRNDGESNFTLNCYDANYNNGTAKIIVTGGKFYDFDPGNNKAEGENTSFLAEGYVSVAETIIEDGIEHTVYTVKKTS
jgi:hypothetical protein